MASLEKTNSISIECQKYFKTYPIKKNFLGIFYILAKYKMQIKMTGITDHRQKSGFRILQLKNTLFCIKNKVNTKYNVLC